MRFKTRNLPYSNSLCVMPEKNYAMKEKEVKKSKEVSLDLEDTKSVVKYKEHLRNLISVVKLEAEYEELMAKKMRMIVNQYRAADALNAYQSGVGKNEVEKSDKVVKDGK